MGSLCSGRDEFSYTKVKDVVTSTTGEYHYTVTIVTTGDSILKTQDSLLRSIKRLGSTCQPSNLDIA